MPTYEYACKSCGQRLEVVQSFSDDALTECPNCGNELHKVFGAPGIVLKGSGFYKTDSRTGTPKSGSDSGSDSGAAEPAASGDGATSDKPTKDGSAKEPAGTDRGPKKDPAATGGGPSGGTSGGGSGGTSGGGPGAAVPSTAG